MAAGNVVVYQTGVRQILTQNHDLDSATLTCALVSHGYSPNYASDSAWAQITQELQTSGYTEKNLANAALTQVSDSFFMLDADNITFSASATMTAKYAVVRFNNGDQLLCYVDLDSGTTSGVDATQIVVQWNASGLFRVQNSGT